MDVRRPRTVVRHQSVNHVARRNSRVSVVSGDFVSLQRVPKPTDPTIFGTGISAKPSEGLRNQICSEGGGRREDRALGSAGPLLRGCSSSEAEESEGAARIRQFRAQRSIQSMARLRQPQQLWDSLCSDLAYTPELKSAGSELLQKLQSSTDKLGEGTQACERLSTHSILQTAPPPPWLPRLPSLLFSPR